MNIKTLTKDLAKEIDFDISAMPKWCEYLYLNNNYFEHYVCSDTLPNYDSDTECLVNMGYYCTVPPNYEPKGLSDEFIYEIER